MQAVENAFAAINSLGRRIKNRVRKGHVILILVVLVSGGSGAAVNHLFTAQAADPGTRVSAVDLGTLKMKKGSQSFGVVTDVTIENVPDKQNNNNANKDESDGTDQPEGIYRVTVNFPKPDPCATACSEGLDNLLEGKEYCDSICSVEFKNVDQFNQLIIDGRQRGKKGKMDTSNVQTCLRRFEKAKQKVTILFDGRRDTKNSEYPNILRVIPSGEGRLRGC